MKILFLIPYPLKESPSQRFRFEQYFTELKGQGHSYRTQSFLDAENWKHFFNSTSLWTQTAALIKGFSKRILILFDIAPYDFIFIHREVTPLGPPVFEWIIAKVFQKKIIYDFDDAIWLTDKTNEPRWVKLLKWRTKIKTICSWSYRVSCGNDFLANYAIQFNMQTICNPTTIDTENLHHTQIPKESNSTRIKIGWTGSHSTIKYLSLLLPVFQKIEKTFPDIQFIFIADKAIKLNLSSEVFLPWNLKTEIEDLAQFDIGVMPLPDDEWSKGKCGFKVLQYMALQIPVVASPVGVNLKIIENGVDGFLASTAEEWIHCLTLLIQDNKKRSALGKTGRQKVVQHYSVKSNSKKFISLFDV